MDDAPLTAVHRVEPEHSAGALHIIRCRQCADTQFLDANRTIIVRVERNARVIVGMHAQHFLRHKFQRQQQFGPVGQQKVDVRSFEFHDQIGILKLGITLIPRLQRESNAEARVRDNLP